MSHEIKRGMLIKNLRDEPSIDVVLDAKGAKKANGVIKVATSNSPDGCGQILTSDAEIRWPWEPETAWRRVFG